MKISASQSLLLDARILVALALCAAGIFLAMLSFAAPPPRGIDTKANTSISGASSATTHCFHGTPSDDANRLAGTPTATFDANAPTGSSGVTQTGGVNGNANQPADAQSTYWLSTA